MFGSCKRHRPQHIKTLPRHAIIVWLAAVAVIIAGRTLIMSYCTVVAYLIGWQRCPAVLSSWAPLSLRLIVVFEVVWSHLGSEVFAAVSANSQCCVVPRDKKGSNTNNTGWDMRISSQVPGLPTMIILKIIAWQQGCQPVSESTRTLIHAVIRRICRGYTQ